MLTIVHGSDLHFGRHFRPGVAEAFLVAVHDAEPDLIVISGDLTQRAKVREYRAARTFLAEFPDVPLVVTPGNHDVPLYRVPERLLAPHRNYRRFVAPELDTVTQIEAATVVALDSSAPRTALVNGRIRTRQLAFAKRAFAESPRDAVRIVVAHHGLVRAPDGERDRPVPRARRVLGALVSMGVDLVFGGHLHRAFVASSMDWVKHERGEGTVIVHCGTTTSARGRGRERLQNSFNLVKMGDEHIEIVRHLYFPEREAFGPVGVQAAPRRPRVSLDSGRFGSGVLSPGRREAGFAPGALGGIST